MPLTCWRLEPACAPVAAALREVVSQLKYDQSCWDEPVEHMVLDARVILAIAAELEGQ